MIRPMAGDELDYCHSTWLNGMIRSRPTTNHKRTELSGVIENLLTTQSVLVDVRPTKPRPWSVVGWVCVTPLTSTSIVHYVYVRNTLDGEPMRRRGIARGLLMAAGVDLWGVVPYTFSTELLFLVLATSGVRMKQLTVDEVIK